MGKKKLLMLIKSDFSFSHIILDPILLEKMNIAYIPQIHITNPSLSTYSSFFLFAYMIMAIQFIEIQKKCLWKKWDKSLVDMMEKGKKYSVEEISPFPTVFFEEEMYRSSYTSRNRYTSTFHLFHCLLCN